MGNYELIKLEKFDTRDVKDKHVNGTLSLIWRDWDKIIKHTPKMVYVTSINPKETKLNEELETMGKELNSIKKKFRNNKNIFGTIEAPKKIREIIEKRIVKN